MADPPVPTGTPDDDEAPEAPRREVAFAFLAIVSLLIGISRLADPTPAPLWLKALDGLIALAFLADWVRRIRIAPRRRRYALRNGYEVLTFIPFTLLPEIVAGGDIVRGVRLVRVLRFLRYGRFAKVGLALARLPRRARYLQRVARNAQLVNILLTGLLTVSLGAVGLLLVERDALSAQGYAAAFWWSLNIFTTVGYAIPHPRTVGGYVITGALMVAGVSYIGVLTASLAGAVLRTEPEEEEEEEEE